MRKDLLIAVRQDLGSQIVAMKELIKKMDDMSDPNAGKQLLQGLAVTVAKTSAALLDITQEMSDQLDLMQKNMQSLLLNPKEKDEFKIRREPKKKKL